MQACTSAPLLAIRQLLVSHRGWLWVIDAGLDLPKAIAQLSHLLVSPIILAVSLWHPPEQWDRHREGKDKLNVNQRLPGHQSIPPP